LERVEVVQGKIELSLELSLTTLGDGISSLPSKTDQDLQLLLYKTILQLSALFEIIFHFVL